MDINTNIKNIPTGSNNINDRTKVNENLKKVCDDFESFFMQQFLDVSLKDSSIGGEGAGSEIVKGMFTEGISTSSRGSFGISDMLFKQLSEKKS